MVNARKPWSRGLIAVSLAAALITGGCTNDNADGGDDIDQEAEAGVPEISSSPGPKIGQSGGDTLTLLQTTGTDPILLTSRTVEVPSDVGQRSELTVEVRPAAYSVYGPHGPTSRWVMPPECGYVDISFTLGSVGRYTAVPLGVLSPSLALRPRALQTLPESDPAREPRGPQLILVMADEPNLIYDAEFHDGSTDRFEASDEAFVVLVGGEIDLADERPSPDQLPVIRATEGNGEEVWKTTAADLLRDIDDPDPLLIENQQADPSGRRCFPPSPASIGTDAEPADEAAIRSVLESFFAPGATNTDSAALVAGWTERLADRLDEMRVQAADADITWTTVVDPIRMVEGHPWARISLDGAPVPPSWIRMERYGDSWMISAESLCQFRAPDPTTVDSEPAICS